MAYNLCNLPLVGISSFLFDICHNCKMVEEMKLQYFDSF